jgi:hypothetical protein
MVPGRSTGLEIFLRRRTDRSTIGPGKSLKTPGTDIGYTNSKAMSRLHVYIKHTFFTFIIVVVFFGTAELVLALAGVRPLLLDEEPFVGFAGNIDHQTSVTNWNVYAAISPDRPYLKCACR